MYTEMILQWQKMKSCHVHPFIATALLGTGWEFMAPRRLHVF